MLHGKVLRPPSFGATLTSYDDSAARSMTGVTIVRDGDFVAAAAPPSKKPGPPWPPFARSGKKSRKSPAANFLLPEK